MRETKRAILATSIFLLLFLPHVRADAQRQQDVLTDQQTEDLREAADEPVEKIKLYVGYIEDRVTQIHQLNADPHAQDREARLHKLYQEFTQISDELDDNLDAYDQEHADLRKALKLILEKSEQWPGVLNEPKADAAYDFVRQTALESGQGVRDDAKQMLDEETKYFAEKKKKDKAGG